MTHHLEDEVRRALHPEAPMPFNPVRNEPPLDKPPQPAEPCIGLDELGVRVPEPEPWWPYILGGVVGLLVFALVFGVTMGVGK